MVWVFSIILIITIVYTVYKWGSIDASEAIIIFLIIFCSAIGLIYFIPFGNPITYIFNYIVEKIENSVGINKITETPAS